MTSCLDANKKDGNIGQWFTQNNPHFHPTKKVEDKDVPNYFHDVCVHCGANIEKI